MADGTSTADILRPISVETLYNPPAVAEPVGSGFWSTAESVVKGVFDNLPTLAQAAVTYFPPKTSSGYGVPPIVASPVIRNVAPLSVPPSAVVGRLTAPPLVSDVPREKGDVFAGVNMQTLLLLGGGALVLFFMLRS